MGTGDKELLLLTPARRGWQRMTLASALASLGSSYALVHNRLQKETALEFSSFRCCLQTQVRDRLSSVASAAQAQNKKGISLPVLRLGNPSEISSSRAGPSLHPSEEIVSQAALFSLLSANSARDPGAEMSYF